MSSLAKNDHGLDYLHGCTFAKTVLMILVVAYHSMVLWTNIWSIGQPVLQSRELSFAALWLNSFHIYGFTVISGYLFYYQKFELGKYGDFRKFVRKKIERLVIPALGITIIWVAPFAVFTLNKNAREIVYNYILGISPNQLWFLWMLFGVFIIAWILSEVYSKHNFAGFLLSILLFFIGTFGSSFVPNVFQIWTACQYVIFFWIGMKLRQYKDAKIFQIPVCILILVQISLFSFDYFYLSAVPHVNRLVRACFGLLVHSLGGVAAFKALVILSSLIKWQRSILFNYISKRAMPVYLFHQQIIYLCVILLNGRICPAAHAMVNFVISFTVSIGISSLFLSFGLGRVLIGEGRLAPKDK